MSDILSHCLTFDSIHKVNVLLLSIAVISLFLSANLAWMRPFERLVFHIVNITYFLSIQKKNNSHTTKSHIHQRRNNNNKIGIIHMFTPLCYLRIRTSCWEFSQSPRDFCKPTNRMVIISSRSYTERSKKRKSSDGKAHCRAHTLRVRRHTNFNMCDFHSWLPFHFILLWWRPSNQIRWTKKDRKKNRKFNCYVFF